MKVGIHPLGWHPVQPRMPTAEPNESEGLRRKLALLPWLALRRTTKHIEGTLGREALPSRVLVCLYVNYANYTNLSLGTPCSVAFGEREGAGIRLRKVPTGANRPFGVACLRATRGEP